MSINGVENQLFGNDIDSPSIDKKLFLATYAGTILGWVW